MGCVANPNGVTLTFYNKHGKPDPTKAPVSGTHVHLYSDVRPEHPGDLGFEYGSADWLTDVMVAENSADLKAMKPTQVTQHATSASSKKVLVQWNTHDKTGKASKGKQANQFTIAQGVPWPAPTGIILLMVDQIRVLPADTVMDPTNDLWQEWCNQSIFIRRLAADSSSETARTPEAKDSIEVAS